MKKIKLTENQYEMLRSLNENINFVENMKEKYNSINKEADKIYNVITYSTIAEIRDNDVDISNIETENLVRLNRELDNNQRRVMDYFNRYDDETFQAKNLGPIHLDLESRHSESNKKLYALVRMINQLMPFSKKFKEGDEKDWDNPFKNITPTEI